MNWLLTVLIVAAFGIALRVYLRIQADIRQQKRGRARDWDEQVITRMRAQGADPFRAYKVDFFFALPSEAACQAVRARLEAEGFRTDVKALTESVEQPFSVHATRELRLSLPDMREFSRRFEELARAHGGRYDGWMPGDPA